MTQRKGEILIPKVDFERARITTRRAPTPKIAAGIGGWIEWQLIDRQGKAVLGGEQHNLFLDQGLDRIASHYVQPSGSNVANGFFTHAAVGTGASEPLITDTALGNESARSATYTQPRATVRTAPGLYELSAQWEFDFSVGNGNLTEFGIARDETGALIVRELFRDGGGTPIVITKTSDYKLRIRYTCEVGLTPAATPVPHSLEIAGIGHVSGEFRWFGGQATASPWDLADIQTLFAFASGGATPRGTIGSFVPSSYENHNPLGNAASVNVAVGSFTPGVWERAAAAAMFGTNEGNGTVAHIGAGHSGLSGRIGAAFVINEADRFTKDNEHTLTINDLLTVTWGRA